MTTLLEHIQKRNSDMQDWINEDPSNRWATMVTEDMNHWAEQGIFTVEDYERDNLICSIWDMYKEVNGIRPRFWNLNEKSYDELKAIYNDLLVDVQDAIAEDERREEAALADFECMLARYIKMGAKDRENAIRWYLTSGAFSAYDLMYGGDYVCYELGIPYEKKAQFDKVIKKYNLIALLENNEEAA